MLGSVRGDHEDISYALRTSDALNGQAVFGAAAVEQVVTARARLRGTWSNFLVVGERAG